MTRRTLKRTLKPKLRTPNNKRMWSFFLYTHTHIISAPNYFFSSFYPYLYIKKINNLGKNHAIGSSFACFLFFPAISTFQFDVICLHGAIWKIYRSYFLYFISSLFSLRALFWNTTLNAAQQCVCLFLSTTKKNVNGLFTGSRTFPLHAPTNLVAFNRVERRRPSFAISCLLMSAHINRAYFFLKS